MRFKLLLLILPMHLLTHAQSGRNACYTVYVNYPAYTVKAEVATHTASLEADISKVYCWYASNKILQTKGAYDGRLLHGSYLSFYLSDNLKEKGRYRNGLKEGAWISWSENGNLREISHWKHGRLSGHHSLYNAKGSISRECSYKRGQLHGREQIYEGEKMIIENRYKRGKLLERKQQSKNQNRKIEEKAPKPSKSAPPKHGKSDPAPLALRAAENKADGSLNISKKPEGLASAEGTTLNVKRKNRLKSWLKRSSNSKH